ncbi:MAG: tyrosine-protein phosphatase, partial [Alistipes sp.]|nr:tyrosine-protein phosphatase [Candidatus Alistipes equi]
FYIISFLSVLFLFLGCENDDNQKSIPKEIQDTIEDVSAITDFGDINLNITTEQLLQGGYAYADVLNIGLNGKCYDIPLVKSFKQIETGCAAVVARDDGGVCLAMLLNYFAEKHDIAKSKKTQDGKTIWTPLSESTFPLTICISMKERGGYAEMYKLYNLPFETSFEKSGKTKEEFCNFREVRTSNISSKVLYRGASPIDNTYCRRDLSDELISKYGIRTIINMANTQSEAKAFEKFATSHYSTLNVGYFKITTLDMDKIQNELLGSFLHIINGEAPDYIHCQEGIDRTGILVALLEGIMGADGQEILEDNMITYKNYYNVEKNTPTYEQLSSHIFKMISMLYDRKVTINDNLPQVCEEIVLRIGLSQTEITALRSKLGK